MLSAGHGDVCACLRCLMDAYDMCIPLDILLRFRHVSFESVIVSFETFPIWPVSFNPKILAFEVVMGLCPGGALPPIGSTSTDTVDRHIGIRCICVILVQAHSWASFAQNFNPRLCDNLC